MGRYDDILSGLNSSTGSTKSVKTKSVGRFDDILSSIDSGASSPPNDATLERAERPGFFDALSTVSEMTPTSRISRGLRSAAGRMSEDLGRAGVSPYASAVATLPVAIFPELLGTVTSLGALKGSSSVAKAIRTPLMRGPRNSQKALEEALGSAAERYGTTETPSMIGNTARGGVRAGEAYNEAMARRLYSEVPKEIPISTPRLSSAYKEVADELPITMRKMIEKNIQLEANPVRSGSAGDFYGITSDIPPSTRVVPSSLVDKTGKPLSYLEDVPGKTKYGIGYKASPGTPSQLPPNRPPVEDLIKLRSKLGAVSRGGGLDGYNAGKLKAALDADISNLGAGEGPLGKMTQEAVNEPLRKATHYYRGMMEQQQTPLYSKLTEGAIEDIPKYVFKGGKTQTVLEGRAILGEEGYQAAKKSFFNEILNSKDVGKALEQYSKNNSDFLPTVFNRGEISALKAIAELQKKSAASLKTIGRIKMLMTAAGAAAVGGGIAGKALTMGLGDK